MLAERAFRSSPVFGFASSTILTLITLGPVAACGSVDRSYTHTTHSGGTSTRWDARRGGSGGTSASTTSVPGFSLCGDGTPENEEYCDSGEYNSDVLPDRCRTDCRPPRCGDDVVDSGEECDGSTACSVDCLLVRCGNARVEDGEECDPPSASKCASNCRLLTCGNEQIEDGEECDPPGVDGCNARCLKLECGNERLEEGEECDPPVAGECSADCKTIACGNDRLDEGEGCDPPMSGTCDAMCRPVGCGNSRVEAGEECDPPTAGKCDAKCKTIVCGNSRVDTGEECDPPTAGKCDAMCRSVACGNDRVDAGEQCEPPNKNSCNAICRTITCGDGRVDPGEQCEPASATDATCSETCRRIGTTTRQILYSFDRNIDPWKLYMTSPTSLQANTLVSYDSQNGDQTPGVLKVQAPFNNSNQKVEFQAALQTPVDMSGRTLKARVRLGSGLSDDAVHPGGIKFFVKSGANYDYASGPWTYLSGQSWVDVSLELDAPILVPGTFSPVEIKQLGFELRVFSDTLRAAPAVVYVDSISY
jgi:hypothetical protein